MRNHFQKKWEEDILLIKSLDKSVTFADKTTNLYQLRKKEYDHMINNAITLKHKKASSSIEKEINVDGKRILKSKVVVDQFETNGENNSFITLEYHKENFNNIQPWGL